VDPADAPLVSIRLVTTVATNFGAMALVPSPAWVTYSPLLPLAPLFLSGLYLFVRPQLVK
jgi:hypothetical protein